MNRFFAFAMMTANLALAAPNDAISDIRRAAPDTIVAPNNIIAPNNVRPGRGVITGRCGRFLLCEDMPEEEEPMPQMRRLRR